MTHAGYFEGIGGFTLGAERSGIETIYTCELDEFCNNWLQHYLPNAIHERNIISAAGCYSDIFTAGFPCQDTSRANPKGKGLKGSRSGLFFDFIKLVRIHKPKYIVLENSPMLVYTKEILSILRELTIIGYDAEWQIISKRTFGYADERERFILVAYSNKIRRIQNNPVFNKKSFDICKQSYFQKKPIQYKLSRRNSAKMWYSYITELCTVDPGIPRKLASKEIECYGNAICPDLAHLIFELIKIHAAQ